MKSYTDLEQSKKLTEILPIESADFVWLIGHLHTDGPRYEVIREKYEVSEPENYWPCWSLATLLSILPPYLFEFERGIDLNVYPNLNGKGWHCSYMPNCIENMEKDKFKLITSEDSLIDACYEMILKLHELNLL